ncbi:MAG: cytochrome-c peroxidase [Saprospiraceae bacterium]
MKLFTFTIIIFTTLFLSVNATTDNDQVDVVLEDLSAVYKSNFLKFKSEVSNLAELVNQPRSAFNPESFQEQLRQTRLAYKQIEFLFDYHKTSYNYIFVNGPPLPKVDENFSPTGLTQPNGLQTLDELIFSDDLFSELAHVQQLASELKERVDKVASSHIHIQLTERSTMQALRCGMVRVFTLGVTGFDTPGSGNAIEETQVSMASMANTFAVFGNSLKPEAEELYSEITMLFRKSQEMLNGKTDFDSFDRMAFLKEVINPLYAKLFHFQKANKIPTGGFKYNSQNYKSENLFDEDFLNLDFYSNASFIPLENPVTIELGKMLFYDPILSKDLKMSCASCHNPNLAFTDGLPKSKSNKVHTFTRRHSPTLIDAGFSTRFFWDLREYNLEQQIAHVVTDSMEFNISFSEITKRISRSETYSKLFQEQYGHITKKPIKRRTISNAIAAYVNSLTSFDSEFDKYARNEITTYPEDAKRGFNIFMGKAACGTCHFAPTFSGLVPPFYMEMESEVLGITMGLDTLNPVMDQDLGRRLNGKKKEDFDHFRNSMKTVTVRNSGITAPYMHNGLFKSLEEVVEFYDHGGGVGMGLDIDNQTLAPDRLNLSAQDKKDLIAFMHTLTDTTGLTNAQVTLPKIAGHPEWDDRGY